MGEVGKPLKRLEDERLLRGRGTYVDDLQRSDALELAFVRSPHAHARIEGSDLSEAATAPGVVATLDGRDAADLLPALTFRFAEIVPESVRIAVEPQLRSHPMPALAHQRVLYAGQPVAVIVAETRYLAEDAAELALIDYEPMPVVVDPEAALEPSAPRLEPEWDDNVALAFHARKGDPDGAFANAPVVIEERFESHRYMAAPIETRGVLAAPKPAGRGLTVWSSTQTPFLLRDLLAEVLSLDPRTVDVIAPDVGGGFGLKGSLYPEEVIAALLAQRLERPVRWIEDRSEHLVASTHGREQVHDIALAADQSGHILAMRDRIIVNVGSYNTLGLVVPYNSFSHLLGPYEIEHLDAHVRGVVTNTGITAPYRGAGRPEVVFAVERAVDRLAATLGIDPIEVRERNLIRASEMPYETGLTYRDGAPQVYDSGDYPELLRLARAGVDEARWRADQAGGPDHHRYLGVGYAAYVEGTGMGPFETAAVTIEPSGRVRVDTGASSQGQGHRTTLAQVVADVFGIGVGEVDVSGGDTTTLRHGYGTIASRTLVLAGSAATRAAEQVRARMLELAAHELEIAPDDLEVHAGRVQPRGDPAAGLTMAEVAGLLSPFNPRRPDDAPAVLSENAVYQPSTVTYAAGVHAAVVRVDAQTGVVELVRYAVAHDAGRIVNPLIAEGQIVGGVVQGIGGALYEELIYNDEGQLQTGTLMDYLLPTAGEIPEIVIDHLETPSPRNPLGAKGLGEGGAIGPPAAIANAVEDALRPFDVVIRQGPLTPSRIRALVRESGNDPLRATLPSHRSQPTSAA